MLIYYRKKEFISMEDEEVVKKIKGIRNSLIDFFELNEINPTEAIGIMLNLVSFMFSNGDVELEEEIFYKIIRLLEEFCKS